MIKKINENLTLGGQFTAFTAANMLQGTVRVANTSQTISVVAISVIGINGGWAASLLTSNGEQLALNRMPDNYQKQVATFLQSIGDTSKYEVSKQEITSYKIDITPCNLQLIATNTEEKELKKATFACTSVLSIAAPNVQNPIIQQTANAGGF